MNSLAAVFAIISCCSALIATSSRGERLLWSRELGARDLQCVNSLIRGSHFADVTPEERRDLIMAARVSRAQLDGDHRKGYFFLFDNIGWCGSAGCALLIGEGPTGGACRLLFSGSGWYTATVLPWRDHGYHRLYLPCEARYDGRQYQQVHPECPNVDPALSSGAKASSQATECRRAAGMPCPEIAACSISPSACTGDNQLIRRLG